MSAGSPVAVERGAGRGDSVATHNFAAGGARGVEARSAASSGASL
jgi:hypothetical protein